MTKTTETSEGWRNWHHAPTYTKEQIAKWNAELNEKAAKLIAAQAKAVR